jgi:hypothetical protein
LSLPCERPYNPAEETSAVWAISLSLATTHEIDFSFFSSGYLDVSVPHVGHSWLWIHHELIWVPRDHHLFVNSPGHFADFHALHRLLMPRHPPYALSSLATFIERSLDRREKPTGSPNSRSMLGESVAYPTHATFLSRPPAKVNLDE